MVIYLILCFWVL